MAHADFAALLCSRLCHDLISPIGALTNGVELLADEDDPQMREQCMQLLADSARQASNRLKFFRLAFGSGGSYGAEVDVREIRDVVQGLFDSGKVQLNWLVSAPTLPKNAVKALLNMALLAGEALLRGGTLTLAGEMQGRSVELGAKAEGTKLALPDDIRTALVAGLGESALDSRLAPAALVHMLAQAGGGDVRVAGADPEGPLIIAARING
jgi:histidine phosphotransferase ChpT